MGQPLPPALFSAPSGAECGMPEPSPRSRRKLIASAWIKTTLSEPTAGPVAYASHAQSLHGHTEIVCPPGLPPTAVPSEGALWCAVGSIGLSVKTARNKIIIQTWKVIVGGNWVFAVLFGLTNNYTLIGSRPACVHFHLLSTQIRDSVRSSSFNLYVRKPEIASV